MKGDFFVEEWNGGRGLGREAEKKRRKEEKRRRSIVEERWVVAQVLGEEMKWEGLGSGCGMVSEGSKHIRSKFDFVIFEFSEAFSSFFLLFGAKF